MHATEPARARWLFGYGSLIWRPDFPFLERRVASVHGWARRFWQASPDHRGVPDAPGRVVTLVREPGFSCGGVVFRVADDAYHAVIDALDVREQNGYDLVEVDARLRDGSSVRAVTYIAGPDNPSFIGPAPLHEMASQIARSHGPSGANREYLLRLAEALESLAIVDEEILALRAALEAAPA